MLRLKYRPNNTANTTDTATQTIHVNIKEKYTTVIDNRQVLVIVYDNGQKIISNYFDYDED